MKLKNGLHAIAAFEAIKGVAALFISFWMFSYLNHNTHASGQSIIDGLHLNPHGEIFEILTRILGKLQTEHLRIISFLTLGYSALRFVEAYGLWQAKRWAEWLAVLSAGVFIPFEILEIIKGFTWIKFSFFASNVVIVAYLSRVLWKNQTTLN